MSSKILRWASLIESNLVSQGSQRVIIILNEHRVPQPVHLFCNSLTLLTDPSLKFIEQQHQCDSSKVSSCSSPAEIVKVSRKRKNHQVGWFTSRFSVIKVVCSEVFMTMLTVVIFFPSQTRCLFQFPNSLSAFQLFSGLNFLPGIKRLRVRKTRKSGKSITLFFILFTKIQK